MTSSYTHVEKMALFSDDLFNVFEEESAPPTAKKRRRNAKETTPDAREVAKRAKVAETSSGLGDPLTSDSGKEDGEREGGLSAVIQGDGERNQAEEGQDLDDEWVESKCMAQCV